jgi:hypothetical protein
MERLDGQENFISYLVFGGNYFGVLTGWDGAQKNGTTDFADFRGFFILDKHGPLRGLVLVGWRGGVRCCR